MPDVDNYLGDADDEVGLAFNCVDNQNPALAAWLQSKCKIYIGHTVTNEQVAPRAIWGDCPMGAPDENWRCTSNGPDGQFRMMGFPGVLRLGEGDVLGIAFICEDPREAALASSVTTAVESIGSEHHGRGYR